VSPNEQREAVLAVRALERYLLSVGKDAAQTQAVYQALCNVYQGPSEHLLQQFRDAATSEQQGRWLVTVREALRYEMDEVWREVVQQETERKVTLDPHLPPGFPQNNSGATGDV